MMFWQTATRGFHPSLCTLLSTIIYVSVLFVECITQFRHFRFTHSYISFYWLESCVIALFCRIWGRKRIRSFRSRARHFFPFLAVHIAVVVMFGLDFNHFHQGTFFSSGGSESFCVSIALTAPLVLLATWVTNRQSYPDKIIIMVSFSCSLLMLMFCGLQDRITSYKMTFFDGVYGFMMAGSLAFFTVYGKEYLTKASCTELLYLLNVTSVVSLPFFALLFGEFWPLKDEIKKRGAYNVVHRVLVLAVLRLASQTACLFHLSHSTPLLNATTRGFAWIWTTIWISLFIHVHNGELLLPIFLSFWIYGLFNYIPILFSDLRWI